MTAQQTSYNEMAVGFEGDIADSNPVKIDSQPNEAGALLPYGKAVALSADGVGIRAVAATRQLAGILINGHDHENEDLGAPDKHICDVMSQGRVFVQVEQTVTPADPVFVRIVAGVGEVLGSFRKDADTSDAVALTNCRFVRGASSGGLAVLEINMGAAVTL
jgi:hypothetical protein